MYPNPAKFVALLATTALFCSSAQAADVVKADNPDDLNLGTSWVGGVTPTSNDIAVWNSTVTSASFLSLGASTNWAGIRIVNPFDLVTINAGSILTNGASGIDMSAATVDLTLNNAVNLGAAQTWNIAGGRILTLGAANVNSLTGSNLLTKEGAGTLTLIGTNTSTGGVVINSGVLQVQGANIATASPAGRGGLTNNNGTTIRFGGGTVMVPNLYQPNGNVTVDLNNFNTSMLLNGSWFGGGTVLVTNAQSGSTFTIGGNGNGGGNMNNFTGSVVFASTTSLGNIATNSFRLNDSGGNNNTGNANASFDLGNGFITMVTRNRSGSTIHLGSLAGGSNTRITIGSSGSSGTTFSVGGKNIATTFEGRFDGLTPLTTANMFLALTKVGTNVFTLTGTNTHNGVTTVSAGTLQIGNGGFSGQLGSGRVVDNASLIFNRADDITVTNSISGSGTLTKVGANVLTYDLGTNSLSGLTVVSQGVWLLGAAGVMTGPISVSSGATFDVTQNPTFNLNQTLSGSGTVTGLLTTANGTLSPGGVGAAGTLSFASGLTELGNGNHLIELSTVGGTNDLISVAGDLTLSGTNNISLSRFGGGIIPNGTYPLINYTGAFNGGLTNFAVNIVGAVGTLTNPANQIAIIISPAARGATNLTWVGDGVANLWDINTSINWVNGFVPFKFLTGDSVRFDNTGALNPIVNLAAGVLQPASVVVDAPNDYTFTGNGNISGTTGLTKTNSGTLTILTTNDFSGPTVVGGGVLEVAALANAVSPSAIGAASANPTNLVFFGSTLRYTGTGPTETDRGATVNSPGVTLDVIDPAANMTLNGSLMGAGALTKVGAGIVTLGSGNSYAGSTVISNGVLALSSQSANASGLGAGSVTFMGGTLELFGFNGGQNVNYVTPINPLIVPAGQMGTLQMFPRGPTDNSGLASTLTGGGTLNLVVNFSRGSIDGNWSAFTGLINVTPKAGGADFRLKSTFGGLSNASVFLNDGVNLYCNGTANSTLDLGDLGGTTASFLGLGTVSQNNAVANPTWRVGGKNTSTTFAGTIRDDTSTSIIKVGTGTWTLTGQNTYTGSTTISNGVLALGDGVTDGAISGSSTITVVAGAFLDLSKLAIPTLSLNPNQTLQGNGTVLGGVDTSPGGTVAPGNPTGTLTVTNNVTLAGTALLRISRGSTPNSGKLSAPAIVLGGTLIVTNVGPNLQVGDTFDLFDGALSGTFTSVVLPSYYTWNTNNLEVNGTISVVAKFGPTISGIDWSTLSSGFITVSATNGAPNEGYVLKTSVNLAVPLSAWTPVETNVFDAFGAINPPLTVIVDPAESQRFFLLQAQ
ncbi:MAG: autotransporter-associated beta strand repeat-containing protein [Akkermansiaceae bacterium]|nr:autotransporter-associated beta strand repeat-containing protein [Verrucomicrobiales bacterium]